ncbi:hypothetical protein OH77DRAFT_1278522 [Trametes cingulata]|nr:hypothetical protein OH77DRAFT_1278522 [Trametes cingulata]
MLDTVLAARLPRCSSLNHLHLQPLSTSTHRCRSIVHQRIVAYLERHLSTTESTRVRHCAQLISRALICLCLTHVVSTYCLYSAAQTHEPLNPIGDGAWFTPIARRRIASSSALANAQVSAYFGKRLAHHLHRFVDDPPHFLRELDNCSAVISGSSALAVILRHS